MVLDTSFIIVGSILILSLIPLFIYRKRIYRRFNKTDDTSLFEEDVKIYLTNNYPKIKFNYDALKKFDNEKNIQVKQILKIEELIKQFVNFKYELSTQKGVHHTMLWSGYDQNSKLLKDNKYPKDWARRRKAAWTRDEGICNRCGYKTKISEANALLAKQMKDGGGFNLENIVILCNDCARIIKSSNLEKTSKDLNLLDKLMDKVNY